MFNEMNISRSIEHYKALLMLLLGESNITFFISLYNVQGIVISFNSHYMK